MKDQNLNPISTSYHIFYFKSQQNKEETFSTFIKYQISSNTSITVFSAEDLNSFKRSLDTKVTVEYNEDLVDRDSLTKTRFRSFPKYGHLVVAGKLKGSVSSGSIVARIRTLLDQEIVTSSPVYKEKCSGSITLCHLSQCSEYSQSITNLISHGRANPILASPQIT